MRELVVSVLLVGGAAFTLLAGVGLLRAPDTHSRQQVSTVAATFGAWGALLGSLVFFGGGLQELLVLGFLLLTVPVGTHVLAKAVYELHRSSPGVRSAPAESPYGVPRTETVDEQDG